MGQQHKHFWVQTSLVAFLSGALYMLLQMTMFPLVGQDPLTLPHLIAAMALGPEVLDSQTPSLFVVMAAALGIHFLLSLVFVALILAITRNMSGRRALLCGAVTGLGIYLVSYHVVASFVFEWFAVARHWVCITNHVLFGLMSVAASQAIEFSAEGGGKAPGQA